MKNLSKYLMASILGVVSLLGALWVGRFKFLTIYYRQNFNNSTLSSRIAELEKAFFEDRAILSKYNIFKPSKGTKDAGPFLNPKVQWEIGEIYHRGSLVLPDIINKEMNKDWVTKKPLFKKMDLDFTWMKELLQYDYWNPEENSPAYPPGKKYLTYSYPVPSYRDLMVWAKLRLLHGKENNDIQNAFKEVRHLTRLIWTNDYLISNMVTTSMLKFEGQFHDTLLPEQEGSWELIPEDALMRAKRHFYGMPGLTDVRFKNELFDKLTGTDVGLCSMVLEGMMAYISMRDMMQEELSDKYERMNKLIASSQLKCRKTIVHKMWEDPSWPSFLGNEQDPMAYIGDLKLLGKKLTWKELKENHDLKVVMGYLYWNSTKPDYFRTYEK